MTDEEFDALWNRACEWDAPASRTHRHDQVLHVVLTSDGSVEDGGLLDEEQDYGTVQTSPRTSAPLS